ncbi:hypothetical protein [Bacillus thuringiensis]|uniref:Uncharacterized protein n=1 Tax=Bacillus thuringiensis TaxID=1428 RepID=A0A9W3SIL8_BACTU|nr:hypothetical protein [Bacillus thuringiensis]ANS51879.1 hypothetical protein BT246_65870 [Bacillus thuringiensis]
MNKKSKALGILIALSLALGIGVHTKQTKNIDKYTDKVLIQYSHGDIGG